VARPYPLHPTAAERDRLQKLHFMRCPKCGLELKKIRFREVHVGAREGDGFKRVLF
jgi:uncharacterized protein with PIN domain